MNRVGAARPDPTTTLFDSLFLRCVKRYKHETFHNIDSVLKNVVSNFQKDVFINSEVTVFLRKRIFAIFKYIFAYNSRTTIFSKFDHLT